MEAIVILEDVKVHARQGMGGPRGDEMGV